MSINLSWVDYQTIVEECVTNWIELAKEEEVSVDPDSGEIGRSGLPVSTLYSEHVDDYNPASNTSYDLKDVVDILQKSRNSDYYQTDLNAYVVLNKGMSELIFSIFSACFNGDVADKIQENIK